MDQEKPKAKELGLIWGAQAIADALSLKRTQAYHLLSKGMIRGARRMGKAYFVSRADLREQFGGE